jgi:hypothetical protein
MTDAGFFKGTSADQDSRFSDKNKKLMKTMKFADNLEKKVKLTIFNSINDFLCFVLFLIKNQFFIQILDRYEKNQTRHNETVHNYQTQLVNAHRR